MNNIIEFIKKPEALALLAQLAPVVVPYLMEFLNKFQDTILPNMKLPFYVKWGISALVGWLITKLGTLVGADVSEVAGAVTGLVAAIGYGVAREKPPHSA